MSSITLHIELADINVFKELGISTDGKVQGYLFRLRVKEKLTKQAYWCTRNLHELCGTKDVWITVRIKTFFLEM